jgi:hypothetical protein
MKKKQALSFTSKTPTFYLTGGIGNQLFGSAAGKAYSKHNGLPVKFDVSDIGKGFTKHESSIEAFSFDFEIAKGKSYLQKLVHRIFNRISRILYETTGKKLLSIYDYRSTEIGYDAKLLSQRFKYNFRGYYQSWKYVDSVFESFPTRELILKNPSQWFHATSELALTTKPIVVHVRRGDYKKLSDTYGLLSAEYYAIALQNVREYLPKNPIWVFSDDIDEAKTVLSNVVPPDTQWITPPSGSDPVESLVLMAFGVANIIGNSTYSWWGAMLNRSSVVTVAPQKWFRNLNDPIDLYPHAWLQVSSTWED